MVGAAQCRCLIPRRSRARARARGTRRDGPCRREIPSSRPDASPFSRRVTRNLPSSSMTAATTTTRSVMPSWIFVLLRGSSCFVFRIVRVRLAQRCHRAYQTFRFSRRAQHGAEVHQCLIEVEGTALRDQRCRDSPELLFWWRVLWERPGRRIRETARARRWYREWPPVRRNAKLRIAPAVYAPIPLNESRVASSDGSFPP